jgi:kynureninase
VSRHQIGLLAARFDALDLDPQIIARDHGTPLEVVAGFLALRAPGAAAIAAAMHARGVATDTRGDLLRLGPAPYLADAQLEQAIAVLGDVVRGGAVARA